MSALTIFTDREASQPVWHSTDAEEIRERLSTKGVRFERWEADRDLGENPDPETVINAYQHAIDRLVAEKGYQSWDVISMRADNPQKTVLREKFLSEHTHGEDEVRFFVEGAGLFCLFSLGAGHWELRGSMGLSSGLIGFGEALRDDTSGSPASRAKRLLRTPPL